MTDYSDLNAVFLNCSLKRSSETSHTQTLMDVSKAIMQTNGVSTQTIRVADYEVPPGVYPDMTEHGWPKDDWPAIQEKVMAAEILIIGTPIWLGDKSSICTSAIERLYGYSGKAQPSGAIRLLRSRRGLHHHRQRRWYQALRHEHPLFAATSGLCHSPAGRRRLDR
ncbi:NAD(P)H-dependent oxidoreductase [Devosia algicola]|uniref:NAD(P)H-dependent oxidoreductase n=1 Tax=Devosia algicola TaxID=3026418 RepID=A0ABY7YNZ3_9HYPH|nr:NAD(P)H-dependent oxidoreductase [Devosia algicola]WDR02785.1 NAD(P)H-dependent oxidoreductase [Devosia algicola]